MLSAKIKARATKIMLWWLQSRYWRVPRDVPYSPVWDVQLNQWLDALAVKLKVLGRATLPLLDDTATVADAHVVDLGWLATVEGYELVRPRRRTIARAHRLFRACTFRRAAFKDLAGLSAWNYEVYTGARSSLPRSPLTRPFTAPTK